MPVSAERQKRWVWTSANGNYLIGQFDGQRFTPETGPHRADWGKNFYAVQTYSDIPHADARRIQIAWMREGRYPRMPFNQQMAFPCELTVRRAPEGLRLFRSPVREISVLHTNTEERVDETLEPGQTLIAASGGDLFDIRAEIELRQANRITLKLRGEAVEYSVTDRRLTCLGQSAPLDPLKETIQLQALLDRTSIEVFANGGRVSMSSCFLPRQTNNPVELAVSGGRAKLRNLVVHRLKSAWEN
jgi:levanase/fructan beta-fructosidase